LCGGLEDLGDVIVIYAAVPLKSLVWAVAEILAFAKSYKSAAIVE
jgi:hypothetical protein